MTYKKLRNYPDYEVYRSGRVWSLKSQKYIEPFYSGGYYQIRLVDNKGNRKVFPVHRLVAMVWLKKPRDWKNMVVHHRDGDNTNNHKNNLEWVTRSENAKYAQRDDCAYGHEIRLLKAARKEIDKAVRVLSKGQQTVAIDNAVAIMRQVLASIEEGKENDADCK